MLLIGIGPAINLLLNKFAAVQRTERRAGQEKVMVGCDGQEAFIIGVAALIGFQILIHILFFIIRFKQAPGVFFPGTKVIFVKHHHVPVGDMHPFIVGLDAARGPVYPQIILKGTKAHKRSVLIKLLIRHVIWMAAGKLPPLKIKVRHQVFAPGALHGGLEGKHQHLGKAHPLGKLIGGERFAKAHLGIPQKFGGAVLALFPVFFGNALEIFHGALHGGFLLRAHAKITGAVFHVVRAVHHGQIGGLHILLGAGKPLALPDKTAFF